MTTRGGAEMKRKIHSHPAHRNVPDADLADNPNMTEEAKARSDRWLRELEDSDRDMLAKQTFIGKVFMGTN